MNALLTAMLEQAIDEFVRPMSKSEMEEHAAMVRDEATEWLTSVSKEVGSFRWVCGELGLDSEDILEEVVVRRLEYDARRETARQKRAARRRK